jgi:chromosome segregation ATPase
VREDPVPGEATPRTGHSLVLPDSLTIHPPPQRKQEHRESDAQLASLKKSLQETEATNADLRKELSAKTEEIEEHVLSLEKAQKELEKQREWRNECTSLEHRLASSLNRLAEVDRERSELEKKLVLEAEASADLQDALVKMKTRNGGLQESLDSALLKTDKLERALQSMSRTKESLESQLGEVNQSYKECETRLAKKCLELKESLNRASEVHLALTARNAELQSLQGEQLSLQKSLKFSEESLRSSELCVETVNYSCKTLHEEIAGLVKQSEEWRHSSLDFEKRLQAAEEELAALKAEKMSLQRSSAELTVQLLSETSLKATTLSSLENVTQQLAAERSSHESLVEDLNHQLLTAESLRRELSKELSNRSQTIDELNDLLRVSQSEAHSLAKAAAEQQKALSALQTLSDGYASAAASLKSDLAESVLDSEISRAANETLTREQSQLLSLLEAHKVASPPLSPRLTHTG